MKLFNFRTVGGDENALEKIKRLAYYFGFEYTSKFRWYLQEVKTS